ncbi:PD40 domain-containing protein [bacterium]|nr:PD40 domain-containing protein [bacterium]
MKFCKLSDLFLLLLILISASGSRATEFREVYSSEVHDGAPSWGAGGEQIAFTSTKSGDWEVWIVDAWGGEPVNFSQYPDTTDIYADWSPDGTRIAFSSKRNNGHGLNDYDIWIQDLGSRELICVTEYDGYDNWATFNPTGDKIAFTSDRGGDNQIWVMSLDDPSAAFQVSVGTEECQHACWSPDGNWVAYDAVMDGGGQRSIYRAAADGSGQGAGLVPMGLLIATNPHWSPDGRFIVLAGGEDVVDWDLYLWDLLDESLIQLTETRYPEQSPVWNDAGTEIAYATVIAENKDLWVAYELPIGTATLSSDWGDLKRRFSR